MVRSIGEVRLVQTPPGESTGWLSELFQQTLPWSFEDYIEVTGSTNRLIELVDGRLEVLPLPSLDHQEVALFIVVSLNAFAKPRLGRAVIAGYPIKSAGDNGREPDVVFVLAEHFSWVTAKFAHSADLVVEVLSQDRKRDLVEKRAEYARANIREYHLVDLEQRTITVLTLRQGEYVEHGVFRDGAKVTSPLLPGWEMDVSACLDAGKIV